MSAIEVKKVDKVAELEQRICQLEKQIIIQKKHPNQDCYTYEELAQAAGCSVSKIRDHERNGKIIPRYPNAKKRFHPNDVEMYLRGRKGQSKATR